MEKLCRLKPLLCGLSPAVLTDLQWAEITEASQCQCLRSLLNELKPGHRAMLYNAMQEVMVVLCFLSMSSLVLIFSSPSKIYLNKLYCHVFNKMTIKEIMFFE